MEQRLAPLFMMSHQQGRRFKRATTVGSYTVQVVNVTSVAPGYALKKGICLHVSCLCLCGKNPSLTGLRFSIFCMNTKAVSATCGASWGSGTNGLLFLVSHVCMHLIFQKWSLVISVNKHILFGCYGDWSKVHILLQSLIFSIMKSYRLSSEMKKKNFLGLPFLGNSMKLELLFNFVGGKKV